ncbi:MAG: ATP-binding protein [Clostridia bacterium]|nr:ATP-binding protein [Clostridia bacterium]
MREDLLREAEAQTRETQRKNEETVLRRRQEIYEKYPEIRTLMEKRENLIYGSILDMLRGSGSAEDLPERMEEASAKIREGLKSRGLPEDYLSPIYDCPLCQDTGVVGEKIRERCECVKKRYQALVREAVGIKNDGSETFEAFRSDLFPDTMLPGSRNTQRQQMERVRRYCEKWANEYPEVQTRDMVLSGKTGLGKTFLLHAMANRLIQRDVPVLLVSAYSFLETARRSWFENDDGLKELMETEVLMLDDLGSEPMMQNVTTEQLFNLINERQRAGRATVISTNLNEGELKERYSERILSRLTDGRNCMFVPIQGQDIRNGRR